MSYHTTVNTFTPKYCGLRHCLPADSSSWTEHNHCGALKRCCCRRPAHHQNPNQTELNREGEGECLLLRTAHARARSLAKTLSPTRTRRICRRTASQSTIFGRECVACCMMGGDTGCLTIMPSFSWLIRVSDIPIISSNNQLQTRENGPIAIRRLQVLKTILLHWQQLKKT